MENKRIIFQNNEGGISVIIPCECGLSLAEIAAKDVPTGKPYKIVAASEVPAGREQRNQWTVDAADLTDGVGQ